MSEAQDSTHLMHARTRKKMVFVKLNLVRPWRKAQKSVIISDQTEESKNPEIFNLKISHQYEDCLYLAIVPPCQTCKLVSREVKYT